MLTTGPKFQEMILRSIRDPAVSPVTEEAFNELALESYAHQREENPVYRRFCEHCREHGRLRGLKDSPQSWKDIPALPISAFKAHEVLSFPRERIIREFLTSGTSYDGRRGRHFFETMDYYDAAIATLFKKHVLPDRNKIAVASLIPSAEE